MTAGSLLCRLLMFTCCSLVAALTSFAACADAKVKLPVIKVDASDLTPLLVGLQIGRQAKALIPDVEYRYDAYLSTALSQTAFDDIARQDLPKLIKSLDVVYRQELKGVAGAWSLTHTNQLGDGLLSLDEYRLLNVMPDFGLSPDGIGFGVMGEASAEAGPIVGRNQDWENAAGLRTLQAINVYQYQERVVVSIGFAGIISALTGFNDQGLLLSHFDAEPHSPYRSAYRGPDDVNSITFALRAALESTATNKQAARFLAAKVYGFDNSFLMADNKNVQVLEYTVAKIANVRTWDSALHRGERWERKEQIAVVGCHMLASLTNNCKDVKNIVRWQRLRELAQFDSERPAEISDISAILFDTANDQYEIMSPKTIQSLIYLPLNNSVYLFVGPTKNDPQGTTVHSAYLDLLPQDFVTRESQKEYIDIVLLTWALLAIMLGVVLWIFLQPANKVKK